MSKDLYCKKINYDKTYIEEDPFCVKPLHKNIFLQKNKYLSEYLEDWEKDRVKQNLKINEKFKTVDGQSIIGEGNIDIPDPYDDSELRNRINSLEKNQEYTYTNYINPKDYSSIIQDGQNKRISIQNLFKEAFNVLDIQEIKLQGLTIPAEKVLLTDFDLDLAQLLLRHAILYENQWETLQDKDKDPKKLYFIVEGDAPTPPGPEPEKETIIWDFSEFTEKVVRDVEYRGWNIINNNRSPQDYIDMNGIYWSGTSRANARYATYTPPKDGTITVEFKAPKADVVNRICALGKSIVLGADLQKLLRNTQIVGAASTDGFVQASFTAKVKAGVTYYLYSANGGCHITYIRYEYEKTPIPPVPTETYYFEEDTLVGPITFEDNTWVGQFTFEDNTLIINTDTPTPPPVPPTPTEDSIYIIDGVVYTNGIWQDSTLIGKYTFTDNTLII